MKNWFKADYEIPRNHPYSKPPELIAYILARACRPGDLVLDPFAGPGSSRDAARKLGLTWRGCDIDPQLAETTPSCITRKGPPHDRHIHQDLNSGRERQLRALRRERRDWLSGKAIRGWWGVPWCTGPDSPHHQVITCEGCATVTWCRNRAAEIAGQIGQPEAALAPRIQGALW